MFLNKKTIKVYPQYSPSTLKFKRPLRFDFMILYRNKKILIEKDGEQHFNSQNYFSKKTCFKSMMCRRFIKIVLRDQKLHFNQNLISGRYT